MGADQASTEGLLRDDRRRWALANQGVDIATNAIILMAVTAVALLIVASAFMIVIAKTWKSHCRGEVISIDDLVAEDALRRQKATPSDDIAPRLAG